MDYIKKILKYNLKLTDAVSYIYINCHIFLSGLAGTFLFRLKSSIFGISAGKRVKCFGQVFLIRYPGSLISIGNNTSIISSSFRCTMSSLFSPTRLRTLSRSARIIIADNVGLNGTSILARSCCVSIGEGTMIGPNVTIMDSDGHAIWPPENRSHNPGMENDRDVTIGKNVWIGTQSLILKGVTVGDNSVIAAGSVVTKDIPSNTLAGGVPARVIRNLA